MSEEIIKILNDLGQRFGVAIDWTNQNIMPYLQDIGKRFIEYKNITGFIRIAIFIAIIAICIILATKLIKWKNSDTFDNDCYGEDKLKFNIVMTFISTLIIIFASLIIENIFGIIQNICMPEITIIEYINTFTGNMS